MIFIKLLKPNQFMKGIVFTEFLEMVEDKFGFDVADDIIENSDLSTNGAYTAIGTYPHSEIIQLVVNLSKETNIGLDVLVHTFGKHLFGRFVELYPIFFENVNDIFQFLESIEDYIHVEVKKLYSDAELPTFDCWKTSENILMMDYRSDRSMADLALGLIEGCSEHFKQPVDIKTTDMSDGKGTYVRFEILRK